MLKDVQKRAQYLSAHCDRHDPRLEIYQGWTDDFSGEAGAAFNLSAALEYTAGILQKGGLPVKYEARPQLLEIARALYLLAHE